MRRYAHLWEVVTSWPNLTKAAHGARRGKRHRPVVQRFEFEREFQLLRLQRELETGTWRPGPFTTHWITRPKPRLISAAPYRDRVVHHAVMKVLEPILERHAHPHSYACRSGKGTHAASLRLQTLLRRYDYVLACDIQKFFPSIDWMLLKETFRQRIKDRRLLELLDRIVEGSNPQEPVLEWFAGDDLFSPTERQRGLPIGNLTSQWFANWYLDRFDHLITSHWRIGGYVRYCDDFLLLDNDRGRLKECLAAIREELARLRLRLHEKRTYLGRSAWGLTFVGYRTWPTHRLLPAANVKAFLRRLRGMKRAYAAGRLDSSDIARRLASWQGHACHAQTAKLIERISREWIFRRAPATRAAPPPE